MIMKKTNALRFLDKKNISFNILEYSYDSENLSVIQIAEDNNLQLSQIYKTLVLRGDKTGLIVALVAGGRSLSFKKIAKASANKKISLLPIKDLQRYTGYIRGGCSPIAMKKNFPVYISAEAELLDLFYVNAGARGLLAAINPLDLLKVTLAQWADISE
jgi:Cys-tRNA(Pro)/Cys-tRNA(Cys) deacylase